MALMRTDTSGMRTNPYWYAANPYYLAGNGLPGAECYAWGRFWEGSAIDGAFSNRPLLDPNQDASQWVYYTQDGYTRQRTLNTSTDQIGGNVACYYTTSGPGHVAIIEGYEHIAGSGDRLIASEFYNGEFRTVNIGLDGQYMGNTTEHLYFQSFIMPAHWGAQTSSPQTLGMGKKIFKVNRGII